MQVISAMRLVNGYWMAHHAATSGDNDWDWATYHCGNMAMHRLLGESTFYDYSLVWADRHGFGIRPSTRRPFCADHHAAGQVYLDLYRVDPKPDRLTAIVRELDAMVATGARTYWTWVDALHMAMPVFARLGLFRGKAAYLTRMHELYLWTKTEAGGPGLYDRAKRLWWLDNTYVETNTYWSRGNGWAIAALAKVLDTLPVHDPRRPEYARTLCEMAAALLGIQRPDGFWPANLGDPNEFPTPETSGTALFTYGIAWGVTHGVLDAATYGPVAERAWQGMVTHAVHPDGFLGYVQRAGQKPADHQPVGYADSAQFGVGAFLLAGAQMAALASSPPA